MTNLVRSSDKSHLKPRIPIKTLSMALASMGDFPFKDPDMMRFEGPTLFIRGSTYILIFPLAECQSFEL